MELKPGTDFDPTNPEPGMYLGVPEDVYHSATVAVSKHMLDLMAKYVPKKARYEIDNPSHTKSPALVAGSLIDTMIFEPAELDNRFFMLPEGITGRHNEGKRIIKEQEASGKYRISSDDLKSAESLKQSLLEQPTAAALLDSGHPQLVMVWIDPETGVLCKARIDWYNDANDILVDLKSAEDASKFAFGRACTSYRYDVQDRFYSHGWKCLTGTAPAVFTFLVVEKSPPYCAAARRVDIAARARGDRLWRRDLLAYAGCLLNDKWPGYPDEIELQELPRYAFNEEGF